jgi:hypothetical protein
MNVRVNFMNAFLKDERELSGMKKFLGLIVLLIGLGGADTALAAPSELWPAQPLLPGALIFDVTDARFGAVPDDGKDDTKAIQAAIAAAAALENRRAPITSVTPWPVL